VREKPHTILHSLNDAGVSFENSLTKLVDVLNHIIIILLSPHGASLLQNCHADIKIWLKLGTNGQGNISEGGQNGRFHAAMQSGTLTFSRN